MANSIKTRQRRLLLRHLFASQVGAVWSRQGAAVDFFPLTSVARRSKRHLSGLMRDRSSQTARIR